MIISLSYINILKRLCDKNFEIYEDNKILEIPNDYFQNSFSNCICAILYDEKTWIGIACHPETNLNSILKIFYIDNPEKVYEITFISRFNISDNSNILVFNIYIRPNRIYISTQKMFQIYNFEANLVFNYLCCINNIGSPWFYVDEKNKNKIYVSDRITSSYFITKKKFIKNIELGFIDEIILYNNI